MSGSQTEPVPVRGRDGAWHALEYAVVPGHRPLLLDLYRPAAPGPVPLVVFVHGGGWRTGSRASFGPGYAQWSPSPFARLTAAGLAVASIDYRLSAEATFPAQLDDVIAAPAWLRSQAAEFGLDAERTALWGESAGGHLAALAALTGPPVRAVVDWYGPSDLRTFAADAADSGIAIADPGAPDSREALLLGAPIRAAPAAAAAASPVAHARAGAPPFLLVHGTADRFVAHRQSQRLAQALREHGVAVTTEWIDGADHMWLGAPDVAQKAFDLSLRFVLDHLL